MSQTLRTYCGKPRRPHNRDGRSCWARIHNEARGTVHWHLYRRDESGCWQIEIVEGRPLDPRSAVAQRLLAARRALLERVDAMDLQLLGLLP